MAKNPQWVKPLSDVLGYPTHSIVKKSQRTGNDYRVDVIPSLTLLCVGTPEVIDKAGTDFYRYSVFDAKKELEYRVTCPNKLDITGVKQVTFTNLTGGSLSNGNGWYKADSVKLASKKESDS